MKCYEDESCWDADSMGNLTWGPEWNCATMGDHECPMVTRMNPDGTFTRVCRYAESECAPEISTEDTIGTVPLRPPDIEDLPMTGTEYATWGLFGVFALATGCAMARWSNRRRKASEGPIVR